MDMETNGSAIELALSNFQGIESAVLKFGCGLTCITGPNSSGKTSVFRALRAILLNPTSGKHYVKKGCKEARVALRIKGQPDVMWVRTRDSSTYKTSDAGTFEKAGRKRLHDYVSQYPLAVDETGRTLNIQSEWDVLFPFDRSSAEMFKLFENIFGIVDSAGILGTITGDERTAKARDIDVLDRLQTVDRISASIDDALVVCDEEKLLRLTEQAGSLQKQLAEMEQAVKLVQFIDTVLESRKLITDGKVVPFDVIESAFQLARDSHMVLGIDCVLGYKEQVCKGVTFDIGVVLQAIETNGQCQQVMWVDQLLGHDIKEAQTLSLNAILDALTVQQDVVTLSGIDKVITGVKVIDKGQVFDMSVIDNYFTVSDEVLKTEKLGVDRMNTEDSIGVTEMEMKELSDQIASVEICPLCGSSLVK